MSEIGVAEKFVVVQLEEKVELDSCKKPAKSSIKAYLKGYCQKIFVKPKRTINRPSIKSRLLPSLISFVGSFIALIFLATLHYKVIVPLNAAHNTTNSLFIYSFGASAVLMYDLPDSPAVQPRNLLGNMVSAIVGVSVRLCLYDIPYLCGPLAAALSIAAMRLTFTMHPPGGATALIAALSSGIPLDLSAYFFVLMPVTLAYVWLFILAVLINNFSSERQYPHVWW